MCCYGNCTYYKGRDPSSNPIIIKRNLIEQNDKEKSETSVGSDVLETTSEKQNRMFDRKPNYYSFMIFCSKKKEFGVAKSQAFIQMDDIKYQEVHFCKLQKFAFKAIGCFLSTGCYFLKITNDG